MLKFKFSNFHFGYFLVIQDVFSKFVWTFPLKKKDASYVTDAFRKLFKNTKRRPTKLWGDKDKAFYNKECQDQLQLIPCRVNTSRSSFL
jgi:hypothetical protein